MLNEIFIDVLLVSICTPYLGTDSVVALSCTCKTLYKDMRSYIEDRERKRFSEGFPCHCSAFLGIQGLTSLETDGKTFQTSDFTLFSAPLPQWSDKRVVHIHINTSDKTDMTRLCSYLANRKTPIDGIYINARRTFEERYPSVLDDDMLIQLASRATSVVINSCNEITDRGILGLAECKCLLVNDCHGFTSRSIHKLTHGLNGRLMRVSFDFTHPSLETWTRRQIEHVPKRYHADFKYD